MRKTSFNIVMQAFDESALPSEHSMVVKLRVYNPVFWKTLAELNSNAHLIRIQNIQENSLGYNACMKGNVERLHIVFCQKSPEVLKLDITVPCINLHRLRWQGILDYAYVCKSIKTTSRVVTLLMVIRALLQDFGILLSDPLIYTEWTVAFQHDKETFDVGSR